MKQLVEKHPLAIRWFHWVNFPVLSLMIWSGMWIYWANDVYRLGWGDTTLLKFFPQSFYEAFHVDHKLAQGMSWHFVLMWVFFLNGLLYVVYTLFSGEWRYLLPTRHSFREAVLVTLHDLGLCKKPLPVRKFNGAQQIAYTAVILMGLGSLLTGLAIYKPTQFGWLTHAAGRLRVCPHHAFRAHHRLRAVFHRAHRPGGAGRLEQFPGHGGRLRNGRRWTPPRTKSWPALRRCPLPTLPLHLPG